jgi:hypothetical protein
MHCTPALIFESIICKEVLLSLVSQARQNKLRTSARKNLAQKEVPLSFSKLNSPEQASH